MSDANNGFKDVESCQAHVLRHMEGLSRRISKLSLHGALQTGVRCCVLAGPLHGLRYPSAVLGVFIELGHVFVEEMSRASALLDREGQVARQAACALS